jgi:hypothetical protein
MSIGGHHRTPMKGRILFTAIAALFLCAGCISYLENRLDPKAQYYKAREKWMQKHPGATDADWKEYAFGTNRPAADRNLHGVSPGY